MPLQIQQYSSQPWSEHQSIASHTNFGGKACRRIRDRTLPHTVPPEVSPEAPGDPPPKVPRKARPQSTPPKHALKAPFKARNDTCFTAQIRIGGNVPLPAVKGALEGALGALCGVCFRGCFAGAIAKHILDRAQRYLHQNMVVWSD